MTTFAPDTEQDFALFREMAVTEQKRGRMQFMDWLIEHLSLGGVVIEHYQENNAVMWTIDGTHRLMGRFPMARPVPGGFRATPPNSADTEPAKLAEKLLRRSLRYGVTLTYARP